MTSERTPTSDPIPDISTALDSFDTADELRDRWRALLGPLGFSEQLLWFAFVDVHRRLIPALNQLPLPGLPDPDLADLFMSRLAEVIDRQEAVSVALLITRPGDDDTTPWDRGWVRLLSTAAEMAGIPIEPIFCANAVDVLEVPAAPADRKSVA